ncbi:hypothetical protein DFJ58DRAFT_632206, partial [Suillus subalutaceus]|uniref:uncharacterized protein n=1 Tax=Suillus subalutaceus TaxID=48586 RepID=UPI001B87337A
MVPHRTWFKPGTYCAIHPARKISFGNDSTVDAIGKGMVTFRTTIKGQIYDVELSDALHVPPSQVEIASLAFTISLISVSKLARHGLSTRFDASTDNCGVHKGTNLVLT